MPTLKPKQYIRYPSARQTAFVDLEGIADDSRAYTFLIMGDDETDVEDPEPQTGAKRGFFSRLICCCRTKRDTGRSVFGRSSAEQYGKSSEWEENEAIQRPNEVWLDKSPNPTQIDHFRNEQLDVMDNSNMSGDRTLERSRSEPFLQLQLNVPSPWTNATSGNSNILSRPLNNRVSSDYLSWDRRTNPLNRGNPTHPLNSSHSSARLPRPGYPK
jgi:hypothetical protein